MSAGPEDSDAGKVEQALRRHASSADFRRDLTRLPQFRVDQQVPDRLLRLLGQIEKAERRFR
jgi:hypothetical protein